MNLSHIRLTPHEIESIISTFHTFFPSKDHLWLFGSRTRSKARGGDIDLYIETTISNAATANALRASFLFELYNKIGEQKIDVVLNLLSDNLQLAIYKIAKEEGVQLA